MWLLRRKTAIRDTGGTPLPPQTVPMRRIEITIERQSLTRFSRKDGTSSDIVEEPQARLPAPPDG